MPALPAPGFDACLSALAVPLQGRGLVWQPGCQSQIPLRSLLLSMLPLIASIHRILASVPRIEEWAKYAQPVGEQL
jgi:hypothetical protein